MSEHTSPETSFIDGPVRTGKGASVGRAGVVDIPGAMQPLPAPFWQAARTRNVSLWTRSQP